MHFSTHNVFCSVTLWYFSAKVAKFGRTFDLRLATKSTYSTNAIEADIIVIDAAIIILACIAVDTAGIVATSALDLDSHCRGSSNCSSDYLEHGLIQIILIVFFGTYLYLLESVETGS